MYLAAELNPDLVSPGVVGFFATFFVAGMTVLLVFDLVRRIRRSRYREEIGQILDAEVAAAEAQAEEDRQAAN